MMRIPNGRLPPTEHRRTANSKWCSRNRTSWSQKLLGNPLSNITHTPAPKVRKQCNHCRDFLKLTAQGQSQKKREQRQRFVQETYATILPWGSRSQERIIRKVPYYAFILANCRWRETENIFGITAIIHRFFGQQRGYEQRYY